MMAVLGTGPGSRKGSQQENFMGMGVPVKWVKQQLPGSERVYQVRRSDDLERVGMAGERQRAVFLLVLCVVLRL